MSNSSEASRLNPDERRDQILRVASSHFARTGYEAVSVQAIAADAGVTRALVYHYFPGKEALLDAVLRREAETLLAATAPDPELSRRENLQRALGLYLDHFSASGGALRDLYAPGATAPPLVRELAAGNHVIQVERIRSYLNQDDTPMARVAIGAWLGFVMEAARGAVGHPAVPRDWIIRLCMDALSAVTGSTFDFDAGGKPSRPASPKKK